VRFERGVAETIQLAVDFTFARRHSAFGKARRFPTPTAATTLPRKFRSQRVPTLIRFVIVVGVLAALVYGGLFYMATMVKITPHEISETIELPKAPK
jgi:hypothetical protein